MRVPIRHLQEIVNGGNWQPCSPEHQITELELMHADPLPENRYRWQLHRPLPGDTGPAALWTRSSSTITGDRTFPSAGLSRVMDRRTGQRQAVRSAAARCSIRSVPPVVTSVRDRRADQGFIDAACSSSWRFMVPPDIQCLYVAALVMGQMLSTKISAIGRVSNAAVRGNRRTLRLPMQVGQIDGPLAVLGGGYAEPAAVERNPIE